ncbi:HNH endonuclease (plasmid) [Clostridium botulinum C/D str. BKT12695]|nr:HNH endonuclease [Clostridium botulinum C/D str. BKT12695]
MCSCGNIIKQGTKCPKCSKKYDNLVRDKKSRNFYHSRSWIITRNRIKNRDNGLCLVCLKSKTITPMDTVHHIEELSNTWSKRLDSNNLISVCNSCHNSIHAKYKKSKIDKLEMQRELKEIIKGEGEV